MIVLILYCLLCYCLVSGVFYRVWSDGDLSIPMWKAVLFVLFAPITLPVVYGYHNG